MTLLKKLTLLFILFIFCSNFTKDTQLAINQNNKQTKIFPTTYLIHEHSNTIHTLDLVTNQPLSSIHLENSTRFFHPIPHSENAFVIFEDSLNIYLVHLPTCEKILITHLKEDPAEVLFLPRKQAFLIRYKNSPQINILSLENRLEEPWFVLGEIPKRMILSPNHQSIYLCNDDSLTTLEIDSLHLSSPVFIEADPHNLAISNTQVIYFDKHHPYQVCSTPLEGNGNVESFSIDDDLLQKENRKIYLGTTDQVVYLTNENSNKILTLHLEDNKQSLVETSSPFHSLLICKNTDHHSLFTETIHEAGQNSFFKVDSEIALYGADCTYEWNFGDGKTLISDQSTISHLYEKPGIFDVSLTISSSLTPLDPLNPLFIAKQYHSHPINVTSTPLNLVSDNEYGIQNIFQKIKDFISPPETINPGDTTTTLTSSAAPAAYGQSITFSSTVTSLVTNGIPTGNVTFIDTLKGIIGNSPLDTNGVATLTITLPIGLHSLSANYEGDLDFNPSSSSPPQFNQEVTQARTATTVMSSLNPSFYENALTLKANVSVINPGLGIPTGNVNFFDGAILIGTAPLIGNEAYLSYSNLISGSHSITATYLGDTNFSTSTSSTFIQTVTKATTAISLNSSLTPSIVGNSVTFKADITSNVAGTSTLSGTITFTDGSIILSTQPVTAQTASFSTSGLSVGSHTITATYHGDTNFASSVSPVLIQIINQGTTSTILTSIPNSSTYGQSVIFTATPTISSGVGVLSGNITFMEGTTTLGTSPLNNGIATLNLSNLSTNTHSIKAIYSGNTNFCTSTSPLLTQVVNKANPIVTSTSSLSPSEYGDLVTFTATVTSPTTLGLPNGTVDFFDGTLLLSTETLSATGSNTSRATFSTSTLNAGVHSITARYNGDGNFNIITSSPFLQKINPVLSTATVVFSNSSNPSQFGETVILRANVTGSTVSPPLPPTGSITFFDAGIPLSTVSISGVLGNPNTSTASLNIPNLSIGPHQITAQYLGDVNYPASSVSNPMIQKVVQTATKSTLTSSITPSKFGQDINLIVTVTPKYPGSGTPEGTISFYDGGTFLGTTTLTAGINSSTATLAIANLSLGNHFIVGVYSGDINFTSSSTPSITQVVVQAATNTLISSSSSLPSKFNFGSAITFTANVTAAFPGSGIPTGTVSFFEGSTLLGTGELSEGVATFSTFKLYPSPPNHLIKAVYSGDKNFTTSVSPIFTQSIIGTLPTTTTISSGRNSSPGGASVTYSAQVVANPDPGYNIPGIPIGTVTFKDTTTGIVIGTAPLNSQGIATITESGTQLPYQGPSPDIHLISATYNGQTNVFVESTSSLFKQYVVPLDTMTVLTGTPDITRQAQSILVATVNVVGGIPMHPDIGTVSFYEGSTFLGTVPLDADGTATLNPNNLHFGPDRIIAIYSGDTLTFATSTSNPISLQVQQTAMLTTKTVLSSSLNHSIACQPVTLTAKVTQTQGFYTPTGTITFFSEGLEIGTAILDSTGTTAVAQLTITDFLPGTYSITATFNSDSNYAFSFSNTIQQTVTADTTSINFVVIPTLNNTPYGQNLILFAKISSLTTFDATPSGSVIFKVGANTLGTIPVDESGEAIYQISSLDVGDYTFTATYQADSCFTNSTATVSHSIVQAAPMTFLEVIPSPSIFGEEIKLRALITYEKGVIPSGSVTFLQGNTTLDTVFLINGEATLTIPSPLAGLAIFRAQYSGNTNFLQINTPSVLHTINKAPTSTCLDIYTPNPSVFGQKIALHATVSSDYANDPPGLTGSITFKNGSLILGTVPLNGCDSADLIVTNLSLGSSNNITATYSGDVNFIASTSASANRIVNQAGTATTVTSITSSPNPPHFGTLTTFNVSVAASAPGTGTPTGIVTGFYGTTSIGTGTLSNGIASFATSTLPAGVQTIIVKYAGDANFTPSQATTTLTILPTATTSNFTTTVNPSIYGQDVTFNVAVTSTQGIPTGTVSFLDGTTTLATATLNSLGRASFTTSDLSVGSHPIRAVYSGSTNLASSTTTTITQIVGMATTKTTLTSSYNPAFYGQNFILTAQVDALSPGSGIPTGTVTFKSGTTIIGTGILDNDGNAFLSLSTTLAANISPYHLTAAYSGDANFEISNGVFSQTINKAATIITATHTPNPAPFGNPVIINVTVAPINTGSGTPSGVVRATYGSQVVGTGNLLENGTVSFQTSNLPVGTLGLVIEYLGDGSNGNFWPSTLPLTQTVLSTNSATTLTSTSTSSTLNQPTLFTAIVISGAGNTIIPQGIVTFLDGTTVIGTQNLDASGMTRLEISDLTLGSHTITALYSGDTTNLNSTSNVVNHTVTKNPSSITLISNLNPSSYGNSITFTATVKTSGTGTPTGMVTFKNGSQILNISPLNSSGMASFSTSLLSTGTQTITATYEGDVSFSSSTAFLSQTINKVPQNQVITTIVSSVPNPSTFGHNVNFFANVTSPYGTPTGTVTYFDGLTPLSTVPLFNGLSVLSIATLNSGTHQISAVYNGDNHFSTSAPSNVYTQIVQPVSITKTTVTTLIPSVHTSNYGDPITFNVQVSSAALPPPNITGFVTLYTGADPLVTLALDQNGHASYTTSTLPSGESQIVAFYSGDLNYSASTTLLVQVVNPILTNITLRSSMNPINLGCSVTFTACVSCDTESTPKGSVSFYNGTTLLDTVLLNQKGEAQLTTTNLTTNTHDISAVYHSNLNFSPSRANILQDVITASSITTILSATPNPANLGNAITFIASVTSPAGIPAGQVIFYDGANPIGTVSVINGLAIFSTTSLNSGMHSMTAVYIGNIDFSSSTSLPFEQQIINPAEILQAPRNLCGHQVTTKLVNKTDRVNVLTWNSPGGGAEPEFYHIYRDAQLTDLIAIIPACDCLEYKDCHRKKGVIYTYYLVAGNKKGLSPSISVTIDPKKNKHHSYKEFFMD